MLAVEVADCITRFVLLCLVAECLTDVGFVQVADCITVVVCCWVADCITRVCWEDGNILRFNL